MFSLATYPAMRKVFRSFDPGFFGLIVADESHRSIYNVYGDMFRYFDCFQVGLTATPVDSVTRNTFRLFDCEDRLPTANYGLEQAVEDGYLVPFEVTTTPRNSFGRGSSSTGCRRSRSSSSKAKARTRMSTSSQRSR